jgi:hypothetical protein
MNYEAEVDKLIGATAAKPANVDPAAKPANVDYDKQVDQLIASKKKAPMTDSEWQAEKESHQENALQRGWHSMANSVDATAKLATKDYEGIADIQADNANYRAMNPGTKSANELTDAFRAEGNNDQSAAGGFENFKAGVGRMVDVAANNYNKAQGFIPKARSALDTAGGVVSVLGEQIPNMVPGLVGMGIGSVGGAEAGAPTGAAIGSAGGPVGAAAGGATGAAVGSYIGGSAGSGVGNALVEGGGMIEQDLQKAGIKPGDKEATVAYLKDHGDKILEQAGIKGAVIGAVDRATIGMAHNLLTAPGRAAEQRAMTSLGVDTADNAAVSAARNTQREAIGKLVANDAAYQASKTGIGAVARDTAAFGLEPLGEFTGEYVGEGLGRGNWDTKESAFEALMSLGQSGLIFTGQKAAQAIKAPFEQQDTSSGAATPNAAPPNSPPNSLPNATQNASTQNAATQNASTQNAATQNASTQNAATQNASNQNAATQNSANQNAATQSQQANQLTPEALQALSRISDEQLPGVREKVASMPDSKHKTAIQEALDATVEQRAALGYTPHVDDEGYTYSMDRHAVESLQEQARKASTAAIMESLGHLANQDNASDTTRIYERELNQRYKENQQATQDVAAKSADTPTTATPTPTDVQAAKANADLNPTLANAADLHSSMQQAAQAVQTVAPANAATAANAETAAAKWARFNPIQRNGFIGNLGIETLGVEGANLRNESDITKLPPHVQQVIEAAHNPIPADKFNPTHTDKLGRPLMAYPGIDGVYQDERSNVFRSDSVPPTPIQQAPVTTATQSQQETVTPQSSSKSFTPNPRSWGAQETNNLAQIIRKAGGIHKKHATEIIGDETKHSKTKGFFTNNGMGIDDAIDLAKSHNFIINLRKGEDETEAYIDLFARAANGEKVTNYQNADLERQYQNLLDEDEARAKEDALEAQLTADEIKKSDLIAQELSDADPNEVESVIDDIEGATNALSDGTFTEWLNEYTTEQGYQNETENDQQNQTDAGKRTEGETGKSPQTGSNQGTEEETDLLGDNSSNKTDTVEDPAPASKPVEATQGAKEEPPQITADTFAQLGKRASKARTMLRDKLAGTEALNVHDNFNTIVTTLEKSGFVTKDC